MDHFRFMAPVYDRVMGSPDIDTLSGVLGLPCDNWLLDVGGGTGRASLPLRQLVRGVTICDVSLPMLRQARRKDGFAVCAPAEKLPFPDRFFERILVVDALHHFRTAATAVAEMVRVLAPGGRLVVEEFDLRRPLVRWLALGETLALMKSHFYRAEDIRRMLRENGLNSHIQQGRRLATYVIADKPR